jgi:hypothetical protein
MRISALVLTSVVLMVPAAALAETAQGENALNGGVGFQSGFTDWSPGGFKWFNAYGRELTDLVWLDIQANMSLGNMDRDRCWHDAHGRVHCDYDHWNGNTFEFVAGVRLRWELTKAPVVIDALLGGAGELITLGFGDYVGWAIGFKGGVGAHYFLFPNLGLGMKLSAVIGPSFIDDGPGVELYSALDFQVIGVEYRF